MSGPIEIKSDSGFLPILANKRKAVWWLAASLAPCLRRILPEVAAARPSLEPAARQSRPHLFPQKDAGTPPNTLRRTAHRGRIAPPDTRSLAKGSAKPFGYSRDLCQT